MNRKDQLKGAMSAAREKTLWLLSQVPEDFLRKRVHFFYSPIGWHFGHIARTEEYWIICKALGRSCLDEHYTFLFADLPENPKDNRVHLPSREEIVAYLNAVRRATFDALDFADLSSNDPFLADGYGWEFALQHECQHQETICEMLQLIQKQIVAEDSNLVVAWTSRSENTGLGASSDPDRAFSDLEVQATTSTEMIPIPGGAFCMGSDDRHGYDNEKLAHEVHVESFEMARTPVTAAQWLAFMRDGGYSRKDLWTEDGWAWRASENATKPEYWVETEEGYAYTGPHGLRAIHPDEPASCLSWFEADAYARWAGMRLPTEEEWEYAARGPSSLVFPWGDSLATDDDACHGMKSWGPVPVGQYTNSPFGLSDLAGNVWEWTSTPFLPYPGFEAFPYDGYSKDHMKGLHKVCRGGSWATSAPILRCSFRNWYVPTYRQGFLGVRLAR